MTRAQILGAYFEVTKPRLVYLLVFTTIAAGIVAGRGLPSPWKVALATLAVYLGSSGANALTCYMDRDVDAIMDRTKHRPLPSGRIKKAGNVLCFGSILCGASLPLSLFLGAIPFLAMLLGIVDDVVIYSALLKRRTPASIVLGGVSGGMPVLIGYSAVFGGLSLEAWLMALLVIIWIPTHIWSFALKYRDDYARASIPMLTAITGKCKGARVIGLATTLLVGFSIYPKVIGLFNQTYLAISVSMGALLLFLSVWLILSPTPRRAWILFKLSSPYLAIVFTAMMIDAMAI